MTPPFRSTAFIHGIAILLGLTMLGVLLADAAVRVKEYERTVTVKGLSEKEVSADTVIWPITFTQASNALDELYLALDASTQKIRTFLDAHGIPSDAVSVALPAIVDKSAQQYGGTEFAPFRYVANQTVTVYSSDVETVREAMTQLADLGKEGIAFMANEYQYRIEYLFSGLNDIKPQMVEEATTKAREVAQKFAQDSDSRLGKIRRASQGQFSVEPRDQNNPHIKAVRVVSTVEYYLVD